MVGMTTAALVAGNTVVIKPSSDTPTIAAKFAEVLLDAGFPPQSFSMLVGSGAVVGDVAGGASLDAFHRVHGFERSGPAHQRTGRQAAQRTALD